MEEKKNIMTDGVVTSVNITIEPDACDMTGTWKPSAVLTVMQLATHYGRDALGMGWTELSKKGALWVVSRIKLSMNRVPKLGEDLTVRAVALPAVKLLFPWKFSFVDSTGEVIGEGSSIWNLMDSTTRRISYLPGIAQKIPAPPDGACRPSLPEAAEELMCAPERKAVRPVFSDLDINGHVSHIRYIDWCSNALGTDVMRRYAISSFRISFMQEVRPEALVDTELRIEDGEFSFSGYNAESPAFIISGTLTKRQ